MTLLDRDTIVARLRARADAEARRGWVDGADVLREEADAIESDGSAYARPAEPPLSREQGMRVALAVREACQRAVGDPTLRFTAIDGLDLTAIVSRVLGEPDDVERAKEAVIEAAMLWDDDRRRGRAEHTLSETNALLACTALREARRKAQPR